MKMANFYFFMTLFVVLGKCRPNVKWHLDLGVNNGEWKLPTGLEGDDYATLSVTQEIANQVVKNNLRLQEMRDSLEANSSADQWARIVMSILLAGATIIGMLVKIRGIKKGVSAVNNGLTSGGQAVIPMHSVRGAPPGYPSSF